MRRNQVSDDESGSDGNFQEGKNERKEMLKNKTNAIESDTHVLDDREFEYTAVVIGRDLSSYLIALILKQHGHQVAIASQSKAPILSDLSEYLSLKYLFDAAQRFQSSCSRFTRDLDIEFDRQMPDSDWQKLTNDCKQEYLDTKERLERELDEKNVAIYEGTIIIVEDYIVRVISPDELIQIAALRAQYVIMSSDICHSQVKNYSNKLKRTSTIEILSDILYLNRVPKSLAVIGGGTIGVSVASCMKDLGCTQVTIIERQSHCLMDVNDIDQEIAAYIESILVKQEIDIITKCAVHYVTETAAHSMSEPIQTEYRFIALGTRRKLNLVQTNPTAAIIQLIERVSLGRKVQIGTMVDDGKGGMTFKPLIPIIPIDYQRVKSMCSTEQAIAIAHRTIGKCLGDPKPNFLMPSFIYTTMPLLCMGQTRMPADNMFVCAVFIPPTMRFATNTPSRGFGKLWISRTRRTLCGIQLISEDAFVFGQTLGILIRDQTSLVDLCERVELPGSIEETVQLLIKQAMYHISKENSIVLTLAAMRIAND